MEKPQVGYLVRQETFVERREVLRGRILQATVFTAEQEATTRGQIIRRWSLLGPRLKNLTSNKGLSRTVIKRGLSL